MKQSMGFLLLIGLLAALSLKPGTASDVGKLEPVELLTVRHAAGMVVLTADTGAVGQGSTVEKAVADLYESARGTIFLDTAENLLLLGDSEDLVEPLSAALRPSCSLVRCIGEPDKDAATFLATHGSNLTIQDYLAEKQPIPILETRGGRMHLVEP